MEDIVNGFVNPGYAVAGTLQDILARKAKTQREAMLDEITKRKLDMEMANDESQRAERESMSKYREAQANKERLNDYYKGQPLTPSDTDWMDKAGFSGLHEKEKQDVYGDTPYKYQEGSGGQDDSGNVLPERVPTEAPKDVYGGSPQEHALDAKNLKIQALMNSPEFQGADSRKKTLMAAMVGVQGYDDTKFDKAEKEPHSPMYVEYQDYATDETKNGRTPKSFSEYQTDDANRKRIAPRSLAPESFGLTVPEQGADGKPTGKYIQFGNRGTTKYANMPSGFAGGLGARTGNNPPVEHAPIPLIDKTLMTSYATVRAGASNEDKKKRELLIPGIIANAPTSQAVKDAVFGVLQAVDPKTGKNPLDSMTAQQIAAKSKGDNGEPLSPEDQSALIGLLSFLRGK